MKKVEEDYFIKDGVFTPWEWLFWELSATIKNDKMKTEVDNIADKEIINLLSQNGYSHFFNCFTTTKAGRLNRHATASQMGLGQHEFDKIFNKLKVDAIKLILPIKDQEDEDEG